MPQQLMPAWGLEQRLRGPEKPTRVGRGYIRGSGRRAYDLPPRPERMDGEEGVTGIRLLSLRRLHGLWGSE